MCSGGDKAEMTGILIDLGASVVDADLGAAAVERLDGVVAVCADASTVDGTAAVSDAVCATGHRLSLWLNNAAIIWRNSHMTSL